MSFLTRLRSALAVPALASGQVRYLSPTNDPNHLWPIVAPDWLPTNRVTRGLAMSVPAVNRARRVICHGVARNRLTAYRGSAVSPDQPTWLDRTDGPISPYHRMLWTVDDVFFHGWSAWAVQRASVTTGLGPVIAADRIPFDNWYVDDTTEQVMYTNPARGIEYPVDAASVILIPGPDEGILSTSATVLRHAADLLHAAATAAETPAAYIELHQTNEVPISTEDKDRLISAWKAARAANGGVAFTSAGIEVKEHGTYSEHLLVEGRNAAALDCARAAGIPGQLVDATTPSASLTYENADAADRDLITNALGSYMDAISARLGMDDVVPRGTSLRFVSTDPRVTEGAPDDGSGPTRPQLTAVNGGARE